MLKPPPRQTIVCVRASLLTPLFRKNPDLDPCQSLYSCRPSTQVHNSMPKLIGGYNPAQKPAPAVAQSGFAQEVRSHSPNGTLHRLYASHHAAVLLQSNRQRQFASRQKHPQFALTLSKRSRRRARQLNLRHALFVIFRTVRLYNLEQFIRLEWLRNISIHARRQTAFLETFDRMSCHGNDWCSTA